MVARQPLKVATAQGHLRRPTKLDIRLEVLGEEGGEELESVEVWGCEDVFDEVGNDVA